jgi:hypothetical protein
MWRVPSLGLLTLPGKDIKVILECGGKLCVEKFVHSWF